MSSSSGRAAAADRLLLDAELSGQVELCRLTDDEQTLLGGIGWALADPAVTTEWASLSPSQQQDRLVAARRSLLADDLATIEPGNGDYDVLVPDARLGLVLAGRSRPVYVVLTGGPDGSRLLAPRFYAVADEVVGLRGLLVETAMANVHDYRFLTPEYAARALGEWCRRVLTTSDFGDRVARVAVEVLRHRDGEAITMGGSVVSLEGDGFAVGTRDFGGRHERRTGLSEDAVAEELRALLADAAVAARS